MDSLMLAGRQTVKKKKPFPQSYCNFKQLEKRFWCNPISICFFKLSLSPFYFLAVLSHVFLFLLPFFLNIKTTKHFLVIWLQKPFFFFFWGYFFSKPLLPSTFPLGCMSQTHAVLDEKQPLTWGPWRLQHLNLLLFLPPFLLGTSDIVRCWL